MIAVLANLDCEARWAGVTLPSHVVRKISALASLTAALIEGDEVVEVWAPAEVAPARLLAIPGWRSPTMRVGTPPRYDVAWADPAAKPFNDRRFALDVARGESLDAGDGRMITSVDELAAEEGPWVAKARWTTAGRDRCHGDGPPTAEQRAHLERMLARAAPASRRAGTDRFANKHGASIEASGTRRVDASAGTGAANQQPRASSDRYGDDRGLIVERWRQRRFDAGTCGRVTPGGEIIVDQPHTLVVDNRGGFLGIDLGKPAVSAVHVDSIRDGAKAAGRGLQRAGYVGPYAVDSFGYDIEPGAVAVRTIVEINARHTFGHIARAFGARLGIRRLGFSPPPPDARVLVAPTADDPTTAWVAF